MSAPRRAPRVLMIGHRGFPGVQGGVESHLEQLCPRLVALGCDVEAVVRSPFVPANAPREWRGVRFKRLWSPVKAGVEAVVHTLLAVLYAAWRRPDLVHFQALGGAVWVPLARVAGLRVVFTHHSRNYLWGKWSTPARFILRMSEAFACRWSNAVIVVSEELREVVRDTRGIEATRIGNGVLVPPLPATRATLHELGLQPGRYVLFVGRLVPEKRVLDLVEAFAAAALPGFKLVIVGGPGHPLEYSTEVEARTRALEGGVIAGFRSGTALAELFANAGVFVLPSAHEGMPIALLEALGYGVPVIASDIRPNRELALGEARYFPMGDSAALAARLRETVGRGWTAAQRDAQREDVARQHSWDDVAAATLAVYESARR
jgi:glycosyltransferase involved in cell wall biosynthesis